MVFRMKKHPSKARAAWLYAEQPTKPPYHATLVGKWQLFIPRTAIDEVWADLASAVERGELGISAKVSTARPNPNAHDPKTHVVVL